MSSRNPVLWKEGLFVKPQHFQQMAYSTEAAIQQRISNMNEASYGFSELVLNAEYLSFGKIAITRARGNMPDGTVFDIPGDMAAPPPLEIVDSTAANQIIYLTLPLRAPGTLEVRWPESEANCRYIAQSTSIKDTHSMDGDTVSLDLAIPNLQLKLGNEDCSAYTCIALGRIMDKRPDGSVVLDERFYPTCLSLQAAPALLSFLEEICGLLRERARNIAARVIASALLVVIYTAYSVRLNAITQQVLQSLDGILKL